MDRFNLPSTNLHAYLAFSFGVVVVAIANAQPQGRVAQPQLVLLDGQVISFQSLEIAGGKLSGEGVPADLTLDDLRQIDLPAPAGAAASPDKPAVIVELRAGGRVLAKSISVASDQCRIEWPHGELLSIPIDAVRALRLDPATASLEFENALATPSADLDRLFLKAEEGKLESLTGLVESLSPEQVTFELEGQIRSVPRAKLLGIVVAQPDAKDAPPPAFVVLQGGSQLGGELVSLAGGKASLQVVGGGKAEIPWSAVARVMIRSSRVAFLSDLKPVVEEQQAIVTLPRPWQRDRSVGGRPLTLGSRVFEKGIGVHSRSSLTFPAEGKYDVLAATIGIDAETEGKGDCVFSVLADGQPLFSRRMKAADPAEVIQVEIGGAEQVTLLVEPGADLDLADHANWCDARFIKGK